MSELCTGVYDERANDKRAISRFLSDKSANASGSILYLYERMNARRCKISFLCKTLRVGENRKIECFFILISVFDNTVVTKENLHLKKIQNWQ